MRNINQLHPELQEIIPKLISACKAKGLNIGIGECLRNVAEQDALYAKGRTASGSIVTNARGSSYSSQHQFGIAFDFFRNDGKGAFNDNDGFFYKVGNIAQSLGLGWGGAWKTIKDKPHLYLAKYSPDGTVNYLKRTYGTPDKFMKTWNKTNTISNPTYGNTSPPSFPIITTKICNATTKANLNMRSDHYSSSDIITVIPINGNLIICEILDGWSKVEYNGKIGYCDNDYLNMEYRTSLGIDTTGIATIKNTGYTFVVYSPSGSKPSVTCGTGCVFNLVFVKQNNNYFYYTLNPIGRSEQATGIYTQIGNEKPIKRFVARIG